MAWTWRPTRSGSMSAWNPRRPVIEELADADERGRSRRPAGPRGGLLASRASAMRARIRARSIVSSGVERSNIPSCGHGDHLTHASIHSADRAFQGADIRPIWQCTATAATHYVTTPSRANRMPPLPSSGPHRLERPRPRHLAVHAGRSDLTALGVHAPARCRRRIARRRRDGRSGIRTSRGRPPAAAVTPTSMRGCGTRPSLDLKRLSPRWKGE